MRARWFAALSALFVLTGCQSSTQATPAPILEPNLPAPQIISGPLSAPTTCGPSVPGGDHPTEPSLAAAPGNPSLLVATWQEHRSPIDVGNVVAVSRDGGTSWSRSTLPGVVTCTAGIYSGATDPWVSIGPDSTIYVAAVAIRQPTGSVRPRDVIVSVSRDQGQSWEVPVVVESGTGSSVQPDKESILADPRHAGSAYAVWADYGSASNPSGSIDTVVFARTTDGGRSWSKPAAIHSGKNEAQQNQLLMTASGILLDVFVEGSALPGAPHPPPLRVAIRLLRSRDQGSTWSAPIEAATFTYTNAVDPGTGAQLRFFGQDIVATASGNAVYVGWFENHANVSTITVARSDDGGASWRPARMVIREQAEAVLPTLAVAGDANVGLLWFDFRRFTAGSPRLDTDVWFSTSRDRGVKWTTWHAAGSFDLRSAPTAQYGLFIGDYMGLAGLPDGFGAAFVQARPQSRNGATDVFFSRIAG
jgi:hypothetical protein